MTVSLDVVESPYGSGIVLLVVGFDISQSPSFSDPIAGLQHHYPTDLRSVLDAALALVDLRRWIVPTDILDSASQRLPNTYDCVRPRDVIPVGIKIMTTRLNGVRSCLLGTLGSGLSPALGNLHKLLLVPSEVNVICVLFTSSHIICIFLALQVLQRLRS